MAPPVCSRCRSCELAFLSDDLRRMWAAERGLAWGWKDDLGYWRLCQACHRKVWPDDRRNRNGSSMPWSQLVAQRPVATKLVNGKAVLVNGDFYLTRPPPELLGTLGWWAQPLVPPVLQPVPLPPTFLGEPRPVGRLCSTRLRRSGQGVPACGLALCVCVASIYRECIWWRWGADPLRL